MNNYHQHLKRTFYIKKLNELNITEYDNKPLTDLSYQDLQDIYKRVVFNLSNLYGE